MIPLVTRHSSLVTSPARWAPDDYDQRELVPAILPALEGKGRGGEPVRLARDIRNADRSVGAGLSGEIVARFGADGLPDGSVQVDFRGVAGQSFGAFLARGVTFALRGEANDYVGKGLSGGLIAILPPEAREGDVLAGNVIAYGATSGAIYVGGRAGERFGIRNSGATLVAEGIGDHGCEYMTGGVALILGPTGVNFAAGMTGGVAYVLDETGDLDLSCNLDSVDLFPVEEGSDDEAALRVLLADHAARTGSPKARRVLDGWPSFRPRFVRVSPTGGVSPRSSTTLAATAAGSSAAGTFSARATTAEPQTTPSPCGARRAASSPVETPKPRHSGRSQPLRMRAASAATSEKSSPPVPVTPRRVIT